jgi:cell division protein FtsB
MSLSDIPGRVQFPRQWPLGLILAALGALLWFAFEVRADLASLKSREAETRDKVERLQQTDAAVRMDIGIIKNDIATIKEMVRERSHRDPLR